MYLYVQKNEHINVWRVLSIYKTNYLFPMDITLCSFKNGKITCSVTIKNVEKHNTLRELKLAWLKVTFPNYITTSASIDYCMTKTHICIWNTNLFYEGDHKTLDELGIYGKSNLSIVTGL